MANTSIIPTHVYCIPDCFNLFLADDMKLDFPADKLKLGMFYQLGKLPVIANRTDDDGHLHVKVHGGDGEENYPADMWMVFNEHCWDNAKDATIALLKSRIAGARRTLDTVLELPDMLDKHDGLLDGQFEEEDNRPEMTTGDMLAILTTRIAPVLGSFVSDVAKLLIQYRRLRKEEQEAAHE